VKRLPIILALIVLLATMCFSEATVSKKTPMQLLERITETLKTRIKKFEHDMATTSSVFSEREESPNNIKDILKDFYEKNTSIYDISFIDSNGIMQYMVPASTSDFEGTDVSSHEHMMELAKRKQPLISDLFLTVEGFFAIDIVWPVFNKTGEMMGSLSLILQPEKFFEEIFHEVLPSKEYEIWIMQKDGTILFDSDQDEIGKNLFTDELYSEYERLLELGKTILREQTGEGGYEYKQTGGTKIIDKKAFWKTVFLHGKEWKVVLIKEP